MNRKQLDTIICEKYSTEPEYPWERYPSFAVFRHKSNRKWFAVIMNIPKEKFGLHDEGNMDVVNLKCADDIIDSMWREEGVFPAYHMNKRHWLSVALDDSASDETVEFLLDISYDLTK